MIFNPELLKGQVALVTGGGTGIGEGITLELARHGADIVVTSRDPGHHTAIVAQVEALGRRILSLAGDVRRPEQMEAVAARIKGDFGRLDILVNNAAGNFLCPAEQLSPNAWNSVIDIVLNGTFNTSKAVLPLMKDQKNGCIVNIGATYAWLAAPYVSHSGAAKAGVLNLTRSLAVEWSRYGIRVNAVTPGPIDDTEGVRRLIGDERIKEALMKKLPIRRLGRKEEIGWAILYLVSPAAAWITGQNIVVDGGMWLGQTAFGA